MKKFFITLIATISCFALNAETWTLNGTNYTWELKETKQLGSATTFSCGRLTVPDKASMDMTIYYTITDLTNQNIETRVVPASKTSFSVKTVTNTANNVTDATPIVGINGGFFNMSNPYLPNGFQVIDGQVRRGFSGDGFSTIAFDNANKPHIGSLIRTESWLSNLTTGEDGIWTSESAAINSTQTYVTECGVYNQVIIYTPEYGSSGTGGTGGTGGYAVQLSPAYDHTKLTPGEGQYSQWKVVCAPTTGDLTAPSNGIVLYGKNTPGTFVSKLKIGDIVNISLIPRIQNNSGTITSPVCKQAAGGSLMILNNGNVITSYANTLGDINAKAPRTAIGYNADKTKLVMLVVDGRNTNWTNGCNGIVLGYIMKKLGCSDALNLDGGGSSQMWITKDGLKNDAARNGDATSANPTYIRPVAESIFVVELPTPVLNVSSNSLTFNSINNTQTSQNINISGTNLREDIKISLSGTNADQFAISTANIASSGTLTVTYKPTTTGNHTATLTISSKAATSKTITISGTSTEEIVTPPTPDNSVTVGSLTCDPKSITLEGIYGSFDDIYVDVKITNSDANRTLYCTSNTSAITVSKLEDWNDNTGGTIRLTLNTNFILGIGTHTSYIAVECKHSTEEKYRIEIATTVILTEDNATAIKVITADSESPVEYYNIQGVRVANPEKGLYIKRQGNKVTKVIL